MNPVMAVVALILVVSPAHAEEPPVMIAAGYYSNAPAVRLQIGADFVAVPITIQSDLRDPVKRADELARTSDDISTKLTQYPKYPNLRLRKGGVSLTTQEQLALRSSSSLGLYSGTSVTFYALGSRQNGANTSDVARYIYEAIGKARFNDGTTVTIGPALLAINDPEKYREQILGLLSKTIAVTRKALGGKGISFEADGLENPVAAMQVTENDVVLFISYKLRIQSTP